jgi:2-polyprenyl-3-methyl-5-hydroxy-6-metoxy-1,4-benzoquinol methylase
LGCDISEEALVKAKKYAESERVKNFEFQRKPINEFLISMPGTEIADVIFMTEVTFFYPEWKTDFPRIVALLKPGGILVMSFRSQYFYGLCIARQRAWDNLDRLLREGRGRVLGGTMEFTWQRSEEIRELFCTNHGLKLLNLFGIGCCSGIPGDPHDHICQPSRIGKHEQENLMRLELELGSSVPDAGRYILAIGEKC